MCHLMKFIIKSKHISENAWWTTQYIKHIIHIITWHDKTRRIFGLE